MSIKNQAELERWLAQSKAAPPQPANRRSAVRAEAIDTSVQRRIIGLDTALRCTGWGMLDVRGNQLKAVDCGVIKNSPKTAISDCLRRLAGGVRELVELYHPAIAVIEGGFFCRNVKTAMVLGSARGVVIAVLAEAGIPIHEYAPRRVKQAVVGFGAATKEQIQRMVATQLALTSPPPEDAADALAIAICHLHNRVRLQAAGAAPL